MGIRRALGAEAGRIIGGVAWRGLRLTAFGLALGAVGVVQLMGLLESYLYNMEPDDPSALALGGGLLALASMVACLIPAIRAARIDPLLALRAE
jgi:putative ABC transport system permease protein